MDISDIETAASAKNGTCSPPIEGLNMSVSFGHIFGGGYAAAITDINGLKCWMPMLSATLPKQVFLILIRPASFRKNILEKRRNLKNRMIFI